MRTGITLVLLLSCKLAAAAEGGSAPSPISQTLSVLDAVRITLSQQPEIQIAEQDVIAHRGALQSARGQFDVSLQAALSQTGSMSSNTASVTSSYGGIDTTNIYTTQYQASGTKQLRFGTTIGASIQMTRTAENIVDPAFGQGTVTFSVTQPLLRGRGAATVAARENAARYDLEASEHTLRQSINTHIRDTAEAYFTYLAAVKAVWLWLAAEERAQLLLSQQETLVAAGERPAAELATLIANVADIQAARTESERQVLTARQALGLAMGIDWATIGRLPEIRSDFPDLESLAIETSDLVELARSQRSELLTARATLRSVGVLNKAAQRDLEPQLDFAAQLGYTGLTESNGASAFFAPLVERVPGPNFLASLTFQYPIFNNAARGLVVQRGAAEKQAILQYQNLERQICANVALAADTLRKSLALLQISESAVLAYSQAVANEKKKLKAGLSTLFDVVLLESRLNSAEQNALAARSRVAVAVVELRFESGTLVTPQGQKGAITLEHLTKPPKK
jgi:outer membrane protein TolC